MLQNDESASPSASQIVRTRRDKNNDKDMCYMKTIEIAI